MIVPKDQVDYSKAFQISLISGGDGSKIIGAYHNKQKRALDDC